MQTNIQRERFAYFNIFDTSCVHFFCAAIQNLTQQQCFTARSLFFSLNKSYQKLFFVISTHNNHCADSTSPTHHQTNLHPNPPPSPTTTIHRRHYYYSIRHSILVQLFKIHHTNLYQRFTSCEISIQFEL